jgi:hypothetical protein
MGFFIHELNYREKSWVIFNKGQFTHICQLNVSCGQDSVSAIVLYNFEINCTICLRGVLTLPVLWGFQCIVPALVIFQFFRIKFIFLESLHFFLQTDRMDFQNTNFKGQKPYIHT